MNIFKKIFNRKPQPATAVQALQDRLAAAVAQRNHAEQAAAMLQDLLNAGQAKAAPEYFTLNLTDAERRSLLRVAAAGICQGLPGFTAAEVTPEDRERAFDILFRLRATTGSQNEINEAGKLITVTTILA